MDDVLAYARRVLAEDGDRDVTTETLQTADAPARGIVTVGSATTVLAGTAFAGAIVEAAGCRPAAWAADEGTELAPGHRVAAIDGPLRSVLRMERPLLNTLQRACGVAAITRAFVDAVADTRCRILHTRKTAPGLRGLDVAAVLAGGGHAHRRGLDTVAMFKDNHWTALHAAGASLAAACERARALGCAHIQVEVESDAQVREACDAGATRLLIDNQPPDRTGELARAARRRAPTIEIEATGGIGLERVRAYAEAGVDFVSVGALTHSVPAADLSLHLV